MAGLFAVFCPDGERSNWRWVFYINLPIGGISRILLLLFLRVKYDRTTTLMARMNGIDYVAPCVLVPALPQKIFKRRTPAAALLLAFVSFIMMYWGLYFLPVYFQAFLSVGSTTPGVLFLPIVLVEVPFSVVGGSIVSKASRSRPLHFIAFAFMA
ncbi:methylenomycin a resistance protein [Seiridium cupressi]